MTQVRPPRPTKNRRREHRHTIPITVTLPRTRQVIHKRFIITKRRKVAKKLKAAGKAAKQECHDKMVFDAATPAEPFPSIDSVLCSALANMNIDNEEAKQPVLRGCLKTSSTPNTTAGAATRQRRSVSFEPVARCMATGEPVNESTMGRKEWDQDQERRKMNHPECYGVPEIWHLRQPEDKKQPASDAYYALLKKNLRLAAENRWAAEKGSSSMAGKAARRMLRQGVKANFKAKNSVQSEAEDNGDVEMDTQE